MVINKRSIVTSILLSIITLGIYKIYWKYLLVKNTKTIKNDDSKCTKEMLCLIFVPLYCLYWWISRGKLIQDEFAKLGYSPIGNQIIYLILDLFGLEILSMAILQNDFNALPSESAKKDSKYIKHLVLCAIMIALATVLSIFPKIEAPLGGSITVASMVPIMLVSFVYGPKWGVPVAIGYSVVQLLLDLLHDLLTAAEDGMDKRHDAPHAVCVEAHDDSGSGTAKKPRGDYVP